jgi:hypothetical protein
MKGLNTAQTINEKLKDHTYVLEKFEMSAEQPFLSCSTINHRPAERHRTGY